MLTAADIYHLVCGTNIETNLIYSVKCGIFSFPADKLDTIIASVAHKTISGCSGSSGYPIGVALVKKFKDTSETAMTGNESDESVYLLLVANCAKV